MSLVFTSADEGADAHEAVPAGFDTRAAFYRRPEARGGRRMDVVRKELWSTEVSARLRKATCGDISGASAHDAHHSARARPAPSDVSGKVAPSPHRKLPQPPGAAGVVGGPVGKEPPSRGPTSADCGINASRSLSRRDVTRCEQPARACGAAMSHAKTIHAATTGARVFCLECE